MSKFLLFILLLLILVVIACLYRTEIIKFFSHILNVNIHGGAVIGNDRSLYNNSYLSIKNSLINLDNFLFVNILDDDQSLFFAISDNTDEIREKYANKEYKITSNLLKMAKIDLSILTKKNNATLLMKNFSFGFGSSKKILYNDYYGGYKRNELFLRPVANSISDYVHYFFNEQNKNGDGIPKGFLGRLFGIFGLSDKTYDTNMYVYIIHKDGRPVMFDYNFEIFDSDAKKYYTITDQKIAEVFFNLPYLKNLNNNLLYQFKMQKYSFHDDLYNIKRFDPLMERTNDEIKEYERNFTFSESNRYITLKTKIKILSLVRNDIDTEFIKIEDDEYKTLDYLENCICVKNSPDRVFTKFKMKETIAIPYRYSCKNKIWQISPYLNKKNMIFINELDEFLLINDFSDPNYDNIFKAGDKNKIFAMKNNYIIFDKSIRDLNGEVSKDQLNYSYGLRLDIQNTEDKDQIKNFFKDKNLDIVDKFKIFNKGVETDYSVLFLDYKYGFYNEKQQNFHFRKKKLNLKSFDIDELIQKNYNSFNKEDFKHNEYIYLEFYDGNSLVANPLISVDNLDGFLFQGSYCVFKSKLLDNSSKSMFLKLKDQKVKLKDVFNVFIEVSLSDFLSSKLKYKSIEINYQNSIKKIIGYKFQADMTKKIKSHIFNSYVYFPDQMISEEDMKKRGFFDLEPDKDMYLLETNLISQRLTPSYINDEFLSQDIDKITSLIEEMFQNYKKDTEYQFQRQLDLSADEQSEIDILKKSEQLIPKNIKNFKEYVIYLVKYEEANKPPKEIIKEYIKSADDNSQFLHSLSLDFNWKKITHIVALYKVLLKKHPELKSIINEELLKDRIKMF